MKGFSSAYGGLGTPTYEASNSCGRQTSRLPHSATHAQSQGPADRRSAAHKNDTPRAAASLQSGFCTQHVTIAANCSLKG